MEYLVLTELTLFRLLWRAALGRPTCVVHTLSLLKGASTAHLDSVQRRLKANKKVLDVIDIHPDLRHYKDYGDFLRLTDAFGENLQWLEQYCDFENAPKRFGNYGVSYKHVSSAVAYRRFVVSYILQKATESSLKNADKAITAVSGLDQFDLSFYLHRFGERPPGKIIPRPRIDPFLNILLCMAAIFRTALFALSRTRFSLPLKKPVFLGSDYVGDYRDIYLWQETTQDPQDVLVVLRNEDDQRNYKNQLSGWRSCLVSNGLFSLKDFFPVIGAMLSDYFLLLRQAWNLPTDFFRGLMALPYRKTVYRALCNRYRFKFFWGRDDYNPEHIMRTQEMRRIGGVSLGLMHGIPALWSYSHQYIYIDFDIYYVLGRDQYSRYYRRTWPQNMLVRPIGSSGLSRKEFDRMGDKKGNDIACFLSPCFQERSLFKAIEDIAKAFPERHLYIHSKGKKYLRGTFAAELKRLLDNGPKNISFYEGKSYDLLFKCQFVLTEGTTLAAEAIQFGCFPIVLDLSPKLKSFYYRLFPGLCVTSSRQAIDRIHALKDGREEFKREDFADLIELNGNIHFDVIREDMGYPVKGNALVSDHDNAPEITSKPSNIPA